LPKPRRVAFPTNTQSHPDTPSTAPAPSLSCSHRPSPAATALQVVSSVRHPCGQIPLAPLSRPLPPPVLAAPSPVATSHAHVRVRVRVRVHAHAHAQALPSHLLAAALSSTRLWRYARVKTLASLLCVFLSHSLDAPNSIVVIPSRHHLRDTFGPGRQ
jgi:hypothetical protein